MVRMSHCIQKYHVHFISCHATKHIIISLELLWADSMRRPWKMQYSTSIVIIRCHVSVDEIEYYRPKSSVCTIFNKVLYIWAHDIDERYLLNDFLSICVKLVFGQNVFHFREKNVCYQKIM